MNINIIPKRILTISLLLIAFAFSQNTFAQSTIDSLIIPHKKLNVADISISLSETELKADIILRELQNDNSLEKISAENDTIIKHINEDINKFEETRIFLDKRNNRRLGNLLVLWQQELVLINQRIAIISNKIEEIDEKITDFNKEKAKISHTTEYLKGEAPSLQLKSQNVSDKIIDIIYLLNNQKNYSVKILDKLIKVKGNIISIIDEVNYNIDNRRTSITHREREPLYKIDYTDKINWEAHGFSSLILGEYNRLKTYSLSHIPLILSHLIAILLSIALFIYINKNPINNITSKPTFYKLYFQRLYRYPISLGLVVGLLSFVGIYTNLPLIFIDLYRVIFVVPLYFLLKGVVKKSLHPYVNIFVIILASQIIYIFIPEQTIYSRLTLLLINSVEVFAFARFYIEAKNNNIVESKTFNRIIRHITLLFLIASGIGVIGNILGMVMLSEFILKSIFASLLAIVLMSILLITINGLLIAYIESDLANKVNYINNNRDKITKTGVKLTNTLIFIFLSHFILKNLGIEKVITDSFSSFINYEITLGSMTFTLYGMFLFFFVIWLSLVSSRIIKDLLEDDILPKMQIESGLLHTISLIVKYAITTFGFFVALSVAGIPFGEMAIIFSAFGVGIGFGLQNIFNNLVSGFILLFERPIKIGDTVEVGELIGQVKSIGIRSSKIRTFDGAEIIVPNGNLISNEVINWTLSDRKRRVEIIVGISYDSDPHLAKEIFLKVLKKHPLIISNPEPNVFFRDLGESSLDFRLLFWTYNDWIKVKSEILFDVFDALKEAGIEIPFPQQDLHLRSIDETVEVKHRNNNYTKP